MDNAARGAGAVYRSDKPDATPGAPPDTIRLTILQADDAGGKRLTKRFHLGGVEQYPRVTWFYPHPRVIEGFDALSALLAKLERRPEYMVVLGDVAEEYRDAKRIRRTGKNRPDDPAALIDAGSRVVHFDIDDLPVPEGYGWHDPAALAAWTWQTILSKVPAFEAVSVHWQASSSAGTHGKAHLAKFHFWALLDQPIDTERRRALLGMAGADPALATVNQANYTAAPIFEDVPDPLADVSRSGVIQGAKDCATVSEIAFPEAEIKERKARKPKGQSGDIPPPEALPSETSRYGRKCLDRACAAILLADQRNVTISRTAFWIGGLVAGGEIALTDAQAALLAAGQASGHDRYQEAVENGLRDGLRSPLRKDPEPEDLPPFHRAPTLDRDTAIKGHGDTIRAWGRNSIRTAQAIREVGRRYGDLDPLADDLDRTRMAIRKDVQRRYGLDFLPASRVTETTPLRREMVRGAQGVGKTGELVGRGGKQGVLHEARGIVSIMFLPDHGKAQEAERDYLANAPQDAPPSLRILGRGVVDPEDPDGNTMCRMPDLASKLANRGVSVKTALCAECAFWDVCGYMRQANRIERLAREPEGVVLFAPHEYAFLPLPAEIATDVAVFDERPRDMAVQNVTVTYEALGERLKFDGAKHSISRDGEGAEAADAYEAQLRFIHPLQIALRRAGQERPDAMLASLRGQGVTRDMVLGAIEGLAAFEDRQTARAVRDAGIVQIFAQADGDRTRWERRVEKAIDAQVPKLTRQLRVIFEALLLEIDAPRDRAVALLAEHVPAKPGTKDRAPGLRAVKLADLRHGKGVPFLHLDGTGDPDMARAIFGPDLIDNHLPIERNARITQVTGCNFAKRRICNLRNDGTPADGVIAAKNLALRADLDAVVTRHPDAVLFSNKSVIEAMGLAEDYRAGHFGALRGRNTWEAAPEVIVIGREQPGPQDVERTARAYAAACGDDFKAGDYRTEWRGIRMRDGKTQGIEVQRHPDPWGDRVLRQIREAEIEQAIDRVRLIHNAEPKAVYLLSPVVIDATIDRVIDWRDFKSGGTRIERAIEEYGVLPQNGADCARLIPAIWTDERTAQRDLKAEGLNRQTVYKEYLYTKCRHKDRTVAEYKTPVKEGQREHLRRALIFAAPDQARALLERLAGALTTFEVIEHVPADPQAVAVLDTKQADREARIERAAIVEYDGGLDREDAERVAAGLPPRPIYPNPVIADYRRRISEAVQENSSWSVRTPVKARDGTQDG